MLRSTTLTCLTVGLAVLAGPSANADDNEKPLDEQKSAPLQVLTRVYDLNKLTHEPKVPETVFRGQIGRAHV